MKVNLKVDAALQEDLIQIEVQEMTPGIQDLVDLAQSLQKPDKIRAKKGDEIYLVPVRSIQGFVIENRHVLVKTERDSYTIQLRLYQILELLPPHFLQISQSEIINVNYIDHLRLTPNGLVELFFRNGDSTYSSRRYLKSIKERLAL